MISLNNMVAALVLVLVVAGCGTPAKLPPATPDWASGASSRYPDSLYLLGRGTAPDMELARDRARADLAKIFGVKIEQASRGVQSFARTSAQPDAGQSSQQVTRQVETRAERTLEGVQIVDTFRDEAGQHHALAALSRNKTGERLRQDIRRLDEQTQAQVERARTAATPLEKVAGAHRALEAQRARQALQRSLLVVDAAGAGAPPPWPLATLEQDLREVIQRVRIEPRLVEGAPEPLLRGLSGALAVAGFPPVSEGAADYVLTARLSEEAPFEREGWYWRRGTLEITLSDGAGAAVGTHRWPVKAAAQQPAQAQERLIDQAASLLKAELGATLAGFVPE